MLFPYLVIFISLKIDLDIPYSKLSLTFRIFNELINWGANWFQYSPKSQTSGERSTVLEAVSVARKNFDMLAEKGP